MWWTAVNVHSKFRLPLHLVSPSLSGLIPDCHKWHTRASEPRETVPGVQRFPQLLPGDGRREARRKQRAAAGQTRFLYTKDFLLLLNVHPFDCLFIYFVTLSIPSWSWRSPSPVSHLSFWPPRRPWRAIVNSREEPPPPFHAVHTFVPNHFNIVPDNWLRVSRHSGWSSLSSPDRPHCEEDQKYNTTPNAVHQNSTLSQTRRDKPAQALRLSQA